MIFTTTYGLHAVEFEADDDGVHIKSIKLPNGVELDEETFLEHEEDIKEACEEYLYEKGKEEFRGPTADELYYHKLNDEPYNEERDWDRRNNERAPLGWTNHD